MLALFFWATFIADGFVVLSLRVGSHLYPPGQTALVGGIGSGSWSAVLAALLVVYGRWFDLKWYGAVFVSMSLLPMLGTAIWLWLSRPGKLTKRPGEALTEPRTKEKRSLGRGVNTLDESRNVHARPIGVFGFELHTELFAGILGGNALPFERQRPSLKIADEIALRGDHRPSPGAL